MSWTISKQLAIEWCSTPPVTREDKTKAIETAVGHFAEEAGRLPTQGEITHIKNQAEAYWATLPPPVIDPSIPMASPAQVAYCKTLFRKVKLYYNTLDDGALVREVKNRTGFDLDHLTATNARKIIDQLKNDCRRGRPHWR